MIKVKRYNKKHIFKCSDGRLIKTNFMIGDVVRVINISKRYDYYLEAFKTFNILDKTEFTPSGLYILQYNYDLKTNFVIYNIAVHQNGKDILYHIVNNKKQHMIINEDGIVNRNIVGKELKKLKIKNSKLIIKRIDS